MSGVEKALAAAEAHRARPTPPRGQRQQQAQTDGQFRILVNVYPDKIWVAMSMAGEPGVQAEIGWRRTVKRPSGKDLHDIFRRMAEFAMESYDDIWAGEADESFDW